MISLHIVEFDWQVPLAVDAARTEGVVVAANPMMDYALERAGVMAVTLTDAYDHDQFWPLYDQTLKMTDHLALSLDIALCRVDPRFSATGPEPFKYLGYVFKINIDQIVCYYFQIHRAIQAYGAGRVVVAAAPKLVFDDLGLFTASSSVIGHILNLDRVQETLGIEVIFQEPPDKTDEKKNVKGRFFFGQPRVGQFVDGVRAELKRVARWPRNVLRVRRTRRILSINCKEIEAIAPSLEGCGYSVVPLPEMHMPLSADAPYVHNVALLEALIEIGGLDSINFQGMPLGTFVEDMVSVLSRRLEWMYDVYQVLYERLTSGLFDLVAVQTLAPFNPPSVMAADVARQNGLKVLCWMHGGYGAYYSLPGYDVSDYRFTKNHVVFGQAVKDVLDSERSVLRNDGVDPQLNVCIGGTPYFSKRYAGYLRPRNVRKTVVLTIGGVYGYNQFYFGYDRPKAEFWNWQAHRRLIEALAPFRYRYDIIIKDYPGSEMRSVWDGLVADLGGGMDVICHEQSYEDTIKAADVLIYSWVSTSFIEGLLTDADILLFDDSDISDQAANLFEKHIIFDRTMDGFIGQMTAYLEKGDMYVQERGPVKTYFCAATSPEDVADYLKSLMRA